MNKETKKSEQFIYERMQIAFHQKRNKETNEELAGVWPWEIRKKKTYNVPELVDEKKKTNWLQKRCVQYSLNIIFISLKRQFLHNYSPTAVDIQFSINTQRRGNPRESWQKVFTNAF